MSPNSLRAMIVHAQMVADATDRNLSSPMVAAGVSHEDNHPVGTLVWARTNRQCNNDAEVIVKCPGGWVAQYSPARGGREEEGITHVFPGVPAARGGYDTGFWDFCPGTDSVKARGEGESLGFEGRAERAGLVRVADTNGHPTFRLTTEMVESLPHRKLPQRLDIALMKAMEETRRQLVVNR